MKCRYCGSNLTIEDAVCPHCGKQNEQAASHLKELNGYKEDYEKAKEEVVKSTKSGNRKARILIIAVMLLATAFMLVKIRDYSDFDNREKISSARISKDVEKNKDRIITELNEMEKNRDYLELEYYALNYRLRSGNDEFSEYSRVFTAVTSYRVIYEDILNIVSGYEGYDERTDKEWCDDIAIYVSQWDSYVGGEFWNDRADSPMHAGEHGRFLADIKKDTQDMLQSYFELTYDQALAIWEIDKDSISSMLYEKCTDLYPKEERDE